MKQWGLNLWTELWQFGLQQARADADADGSDCHGGCVGYRLQPVVFYSC